MLNDVFRVDEVYFQSVHIIDIKDERDIRRDNMECCFGRSMADRERKMNDSFGTGVSYVEVVS